MRVELMRFNFIRHLLRIIAIGPMRVASNCIYSCGCVAAWPYELWFVVQCLDVPLAVFSSSNQGLNRSSLPLSFWWRHKTLLRINPNPTRPWSVSKPHVNKLFCKLLSAGLCSGFTHLTFPSRLHSYELHDNTSCHKKTSFAPESRKS